MSHILTAYVAQQASSQSSQLNSEVVTSVKRASSFINCVVIAVTQRASSSSNPIYKYELKKKKNQMEQCCIMLFTCAHVNMCVYVAMMCTCLC